MNVLCTIDSDVLVDLVVDLVIDEAINSFLGHSLHAGVALSTPEPE